MLSQSVVLLCNSEARAYQEVYNDEQELWWSIGNGNGVE